MTPDRDDPILDALLEEVLGGRTPPDLSARIMQSLAIRGVRSEVGGQAEPPAPPLPLRSVVSAAAAAPSSNGHVQLAVSETNSSPRARKASRSAWQTVATVGLV